MDKVAFDVDWFAKTVVVLMVMGLMVIAGESVITNMVKQDDTLGLTASTVAVTAHLTLPYSITSGAFMDLMFIWKGLVGDGQVWFSIEPFDVEVFVGNGMLALEPFIWSWEYVHLNST